MYPYNPSGYPQAQADMNVGFIPPNGATPGYPSGQNVGFVPPNNAIPGYHSSPNVGFAPPYGPMPGYPGGYCTPPYNVGYVPPNATMPGYPPSPSHYPGLNTQFAPQNYPGSTYPSAPPSPGIPTLGENDIPAVQKKMSEMESVGIPTIKGGPFDPAADAQVLRNAMKGLGTDEKALISVLCKRTNDQRLQIVKAYKASFGKDLLKDLKSETSGNFENLLIALVTPRYELIANRIHSAIDGIGTNESALIDILCTSTNQEMQKIQETYERLFKKTMEKKIKSDTSGHFQRVMISMCAAGRSEDPNIDPTVVSKDAKALYTAGIKKWGTDESVFNMILCTRSYPHLRQVFKEYQKLTGETISKSVEKEFSGDIKTALLAIVKCVENRHAYFAKRLNDSMRGLGTNDKALIFYMVTRCDVDLESIKEEYQKMYKNSLAKDIQGETSGDYKHALLALCG